MRDRLEKLASVLGYMDKEAGLPRALANVAEAWKSGGGGSITREAGTRARLLRKYEGDKAATMYAIAKKPGKDVALHTAMGNMRKQWGREAAGKPAPHIS